MIKRLTVVLLLNRALGVAADALYHISVYILLSSVNIVALEDLDFGFSVDLSDIRRSVRQGGPVLLKDNHCLTAPFCLVLS